MLLVAYRDKEIKKSGDSCKVKMKILTSSIFTSKGRINQVAGNYRQGQTIIGPGAQLKCLKKLFLKINRKGRSHQEGCGRGRHS